MTESQRKSNFCLVFYLDRNKEKHEGDKEKEEKVKSKSKEKVIENTDPVKKSLDFESKIIVEEQKSEEPKVLPVEEIAAPQIAKQDAPKEEQPLTTTEQQVDPDQEEGEERNVLRIIKKKISKSSSRSDSEQKSKKKKEKKHSKKKSKKSDKKSKKKKKKRGSSSESSDSEN